MVTMRCGLLQCALLVSLLRAGSTQISRPTAIRLENNGYKGVLVAIHQDVPENPAIIDRIKEMFTEASGYMYVATHKRAFFEEVSILVPSTWSDSSSYSPVMSEVYTNADVVIANANPRYRNNPYSRTYSGCGHPGIRIYLTPDFLTNQTSLRTYGPRGRLLVHEWGHFRWGVFDEYALDGEQEFYFSPSKGTLEAVRCNINMYGRIYIERPGQFPVFCRADNIDPITGRYPYGCHFVPITRGSRTHYISASIMDRQAIESIVNFCDDNKNDTKKVHNAEAPNKQNRMCGQRSTWAVISESEDFRSGKNPPRDVTSTDPKFKVMKASKTRRVVLVLDTSGSMLTDNKMTRLRQVAFNFIKDGVDDDAELGLVAFSSSARMLSPMVNVAEATAKKTLIQDLPVSASGGTSIGAGMQEALKMLTMGGKNTSGNAIVVLTDGKQTESPNINYVLPKVKQAGVIVSILAFNDNPDDDLASAAMGTGGHFYYDSNDASSTALDDGFFHIYHLLQDKKPGLSVQLLSGADGLWKGKRLKGNVSIDESVGKNTKFLMTYQETEPHVLVTSPSGRLYSKTYIEYSVDTDFKTIRIEIPGIAERGWWSYSITSGFQGYQKVSIMVVSGPFNPKSPVVKVEADISSQTKWPPKTAIYAEVTKGYHPVVGLTVSAVIDRPFDDSYTMKLFDNGAGADITKYDGVYSRFFTKYTGNGRYAVRLEVSGKGVEMKYELAGHRVEGSKTLVGSVNGILLGLSVTSNPLPTPISRVTTGGMFEFRHPNISKGYAPFGVDMQFVDMLAPSRITDLKVMKTNRIDGTVILSWTATGDDYDQNTASAYNILTASTVDDLLHGKMRYVTQDEVIKGSLTSPKTAGENETFMLQFHIPPGTNRSFVFSVRAVDDAKHVGEFSNFVTAGFGFVPDYTAPEYNETNNGWTVSTNSAAPTNAQKLIIAGLVGGLAAVLVVVIFVTFVLQKCVKKTSLAAEKTKSLVV